MRERFTNTMTKKKGRDYLYTSEKQKQQSGQDTGVDSHDDEMGEEMKFT